MVTTADETLRKIVAQVLGEADKAWAQYQSGQSQYDLGLCRGLERALKLVEGYLESEEARE